MTDAAYEPLRPVMRRAGARCTPREFYWKVNQAFHDAESAIYDGVHAGMLAAGERYWSRLVRALPPGPLEVLDVGAGTGQVGGHLARIAPRAVRRLVLLDPNARMLARAKEKASSWPFEVELVEGELASIAGRTFDAVTVSSVFHHVVELAEFCAALRAALRPGGVLLQLQDPRAGAAADEVLSRRRTAADRRRSLVARLPAPLRRGATGLLRAAGWYRRVPLARETNRQLLAGGVVRRPMDLQEIWAVTDFHVPGQPGALGSGVDLEAIRRGLGDAVLVDAFTYEYFGRPAPDLTAAERAEEEALFAAGDPHGAQFGAAWKVP